MHIGKELHDNVNQLLATAKIMIDTAKNQPDMHDICLTKSQEVILDAIHELRTLAHSMMPPPFENNDFENIINDFAHRISIAGNFDLKVLLPDAEDLQQIDNQVKLAFYRIIQEQVSNILKHAMASNVCIRIEADGANYRLVIEDDGTGFDPDKKSNGIGLKNIESRCSLIGGSMILITAPGLGCKIEIDIPAKSPAYV
jgi:two-component system sensor histidine kinase UhpB